MSYMPSPAMVQRERPTSELFQPPLFKKMRPELYGDEGASEYGYQRRMDLTNTSSRTESDPLCFSRNTLYTDVSDGMHLRLTFQSDCKRMKRLSRSFYVKTQDSERS